MESTTLNIENKNRKDSEPNIYFGTHLNDLSRDVNKKYIGGK